MAKTRQGYSLTELIIIVIFLGILAAIAIPRFNFAIIAKQKADCQARKIVTDLRRTRRLAIVNAATNQAGFTLNINGSSYQIIDNSPEGGTVDSQTIDPQVTCEGGPFTFGPLGNLISDGGTQLTVSAEGKTFTITIIPATGTVKCTEN